jgi:hypothetical protein
MIIRLSSLRWICLFPSSQSHHQINSRAIRLEDPAADKYSEEKQEEEGSQIGAQTQEELLKVLDYLPGNKLCLEQPPDFRSEKFRNGI